MSLSNSKNYSKNADHNNSYLGKSKRVYGKQNPISDICDTIYRKIMTKYIHTENFECRSVARNFFLALHESVDPKFTVEFIRTKLVLPELNDNQVMILKFYVVPNVYHFVTVCNSKKEDSYRVYNAFGFKFMEPFDIKKEEFIHSYNYLLKITPSTVVLENYFIHFSNITNMDAEQYIYRKYMSEFSSLVDDLLQKLIDNIESKQNVDDEDNEEEFFEEDLDIIETLESYMYELKNEKRIELKTYLESLDLTDPKLIESTEMIQNLILVIDNSFVDEREIIKMRTDEIKRRCAILEKNHNKYLVYEESDDDLKDEKKSLVNFVKKYVKDTKKSQKENAHIALMTREE